MINYYHILRLTEDASPEDIKAAFKKLAVQYHPDKNPDNYEMEERFKEINQAHQILSDPYEKARFDLQLQYQRFSNARPDPQPPYTYHRRPQYAPRRSRGKVTDRENLLATFYAFGITFLIGAVAMGSFWAKQSYNDHQRKKMLLQRRATFEEAKDAFDSGNYRSAFEVMSQFKRFKQEESDIQLFKRTMIDQIIAKGNTELNEKNYEGAIALYQLAYELKPELPWLELKQKMAEAYKKAGQIDKTIAILKEFLVEDYEIVSSLVELAEIDRDYLNKPEAALENFQLAHRFAVKRYKQYYGEAYPILINQEYLPASHYLLYTGLADMYLILGDHDMAIKASQWNKYVWPDSVLGYKTAAESYAATGRRAKACEEYRLAVEKGWSGDVPALCN